MTRALAAVLLGIALAACSTTRPFGSSAQAPAERQILLTVPQADTTVLRLSGAPAKRYLRRRGYGPSAAVDRTLDDLAREHGLERVDGWPIASLSVYCEVLRVPGERGLDEVIAAIAGDPRVDIVQRMNTFRTLLDGYDDPHADLQSAVRDLDIERAHTLSTGKDTLVAVIDSAVEADHPDLRGRISITRDLVDSRRRPKRGELHGTAVAGIIASKVNNAEGIVGVAPDSAVAALRACWDTADGTGGAACSSFTLAQALEVAIALAPNVINLSLTGPFDPLLSRLIDEASGRGIVIVVAEPDVHDAGQRFPASHARVIPAKSTRAGPFGRTRFVLTAPGTEILTTTPQAGYAFLSGNSLAAAHVSGVVALIMQHAPQLTTTELAALLTDTMTATSGSTSINACRALDRVVVGAAVCSSDPAAPSLARGASGQGAAGPVKLNP